MCSTYYVSEKPDYTIVFTGITGTGKSAAGNFFFNREVFSTGGGLLAVGDKCSAYTSTICGKIVKIIDTPGFFDGYTSAEENFGELCKILTLAKDGIHAVVFVMSNNHYTEQCEKAIKHLQLFIGLEPILFVLLTHANNQGVTKAATDEYIQQTLSHPRCPGGVKNLMKLVKNRVMMLESTNTSAESYHAQKSKEFIMMIENIHKSNACKIYTNSMLQHAAQVYEEAKLQQQAEIRIATELSQSNEEKIQQLKKQAKDSTNSEAIKKINDEIVALKLENETLESNLEEIKDEEYLVKLTNKLLQAEMEGSKITAKNIVEFIIRYMKYRSEKPRDLTGFLVNLTYQIGTMAIGGIVGSVIPGPGTVAGAQVGAVIGAVIGAAGGNEYEPASKAYDDCKQQ